MSALPEYGGTPVLAFASARGGVACTTSCVNVAAALAQQGLRVLCVDLDPQAALTAALGLTHEEAAARGGHGVLGPRDCAPDAWIVATCVANLHLAPACAQLAEVGHQLACDGRQDGRLRARLLKLHPSHDGPGYDLVLLDCPASLGALTANALVAATHVVVPVTARLGSFKSMAALGSLIERLHLQRRATVKLLGVLVTRYDEDVCLDVTLYRLLKERIESQFGDYLFSTLIGHSGAVGSSGADGAPVVVRAPESLAAGWYRALASEIMARLDKDAAGLLGLPAAAVA